jgi:hypothetical protein
MRYFCLPGFKPVTNTCYQYLPLQNGARHKELFFRHYVIGEFAGIIGSNGKMLGK